MSANQLRKLFMDGNVNGIKQFLEDNPAFNVNEKLDGFGYTALHIASRNDYHEIVSVLLAHPDINVNQKSTYEQTPFLRGCLNGKVEVVKVLLRDSRVDISMSNNDERTPLWWASSRGHAEVIKWMIALRGDELDPDRRGKDWDNTDYTAIEIARYKTKTEVVSLLEKFMTNPTQTRHEIRLELSVTDALSTELFAMTIFLCDDLLRLKKACNSIIRFFCIINKLPMELQMILCHRVYGSYKENIKSKDSEPAFRSLTKKFV